VRDISRMLQLSPSRSILPLLKKSSPAETSSPLFTK
jgi:hypothetical protein